MAQEQNQTCLRQLLCSLGGLLISLYLGACTSGAESRQLTESPNSVTHPSAKAAESVVRIMTFNVENLFDTLDDPGKSDETYLPLTVKKSNPNILATCARISREKWRRECETLDWNREVLDQKMKNLAQVVLSVNEGRGPDVLVLQEVENQKVLDAWAAQHLAPAQYTTRILLEGWDERGIDVAVLSRFPLEGEPRLHRIPFGPEHSKSEKDTRGILQVPLQIHKNQVLHVFGVHLPAPYHPHTMRAQALRFLQKLLKDLPPDALAVAAGDFNVPVEEEKEHKLFQNYAQSSWLVAHFLCDCGPGTAYFPPKKSWSFLDAILVGPAAQLGPKMKWQLPSESIQVIRHPLQTHPDGTPRSFEPKSGLGVSDHFPLYLELREGA